MSDDEGVTHTRDVVVDEHWRPGSTTPERDWRAIYETDDGASHARSPWLDDIDVDGEEGIEFAFARERVDLPPDPPPGPPRRLTGWARVKDTAHGLAIVLAWLLVLAYLTWATMPPSHP